MRIKSLKARCAGLAVAMALVPPCGAQAWAGTACAQPQRLCASVDANTSARPRADAAYRHVSFTRTDGSALAAAAVVAVADPEIQPKRPARADAPPSNPNTAAPGYGTGGASGTTASTQAATPAASPPGAPGPDAAQSAAPPARPALPIRLALLLPIRSATLATAAEAVRAGFMAGLERDGAGFKVDIVSTGDAASDVLEAYARAAANNDIVVGPLSRSAVGALAASDAVAKPTIALSAPETDRPLPRALLVAGLSLEDEARQVAEWAAREHPHGRALVLTGGAAWAQRAAGAFEAGWTRLGLTSQRFALPSGAAQEGTPTLDALRQRLEIDPPDLLFAALDGAELGDVRRQIQSAGAAAIPCYGGGAANPGRAGMRGTPADGTATGAAAALDGVRILDLPWIVRPELSTVMVYPRPLNTEQPLDMDRLYALGIDAFRVAREIALHPGAPFNIDGVTGRLTVGVNAETRQLRLERREAVVVVRGGAFEPVDTGP